MIRLLTLLVALLAMPQTHAQNQQPAKASAATAKASASNFDLQGHRGARGLAPENTLAAFNKALDIGVTTLELDIGLTADGVVVISHDRTLNPAFTRDASGAWISQTPSIASLTLAQLQSYDVGRINPTSAYAASFPQQTPSDGQRIPTLASLFELVKQRHADAVRFNIETKLHPALPEQTASPERMVAALLAVIAKHGMAHRVTVQSFDWRSLRLVQAANAKAISNAALHKRKTIHRIHTVYLSAQRPGGDTIGNAANPAQASVWTAGIKLAEHGSTPRMVKAAGGDVWSPHFMDVAEGLVKASHTLGLPVIPWTVNAPADMQRLIDWGVDGIITDYPDQLRALMQARGMELPALPR
jgi:glycerophosphoryl diester phosphodiesterase